MVIYWRNARIQFFYVTFSSVAFPWNYQVAILYNSSCLHGGFACNYTFLFFKCNAISHCFMHLLKGHDTLNVSYFCLQHLETSRTASVTPYSPTGSKLRLQKMTYWSSSTNGGLNFSIWFYVMYSISPHQSANAGLYLWVWAPCFVTVSLFSAGSVLLVLERTCFVKVPLDATRRWWIWSFDSKWKL